jgi:carbon storage regulator CsrA
MLVLSRREGEQIVVPASRLTVTVLGIEGKRVRLGVSAPRGVAVHRKEVLDHNATSHAREEVAAAALEDPLMPVRVLIADPDEYLLDRYREYLEQQGFEVVTATNGLECVERLRDAAPDVLVLEPALPWGWGDGVLAMMHEESDLPLVPVVVLSYGRDRGVLYRLSPFRIDDYQTKPLTPKRLAERVGTLVRRNRSDSQSASRDGAGISVKRHA